MPIPAQFLVGVAALLAASPAPARQPAALNAWAAPPHAASQNPRSDPWLGDDKFRHLTMSFASTSFAFAAARSAGVDEAAAPAAVAAFVGGIGKELYDVRAGRFFSVRDLAWDLAGVLAGYALARQAR
jgi:uncharacterized protein YfiM (DUF2279 family)